MGGIRRRYILMAACGALCASRAFGATNASWLSPADGSWTTPAAWSSNPAYPQNAQPNPVDLYNAVIAATGAPYTVSLGTDITISSLTLNSTTGTLFQSAGTLHILDAATFTTGTYSASGSY